MDRLIEQYGKAFASELLDILFIKDGKLEDADWRFFLLKHGLIKQTTKMIQSNVFYVSYSREWHVRLKNGRGLAIITLVISDERIPQIRKELSE